MPLWTEGLWAEGLWADDLWVEDAAPPGTPPTAAQASSRGIRVYIGIGICLALMFLL
ncbi:MAG: hypothetical protein AB7R40_23435 [Nitrospiraceae bacterium]